MAYIITCKLATLHASLDCVLSAVPFNLCVISCSFSYYAIYAYKYMDACMSI